MGFLPAAQLLIGDVFAALLPVTAPVPAPGITSGKTMETGSGDFSSHIQGIFICHRHNTPHQTAGH